MTAKTSSKELRQMTTQTARRIKETLPSLKELRVSKNNDPVNHPSHYTSHPSGVECIEITRHMTFNIGNVIKYVWRSGQKEGQPTLQDLKKALWYLNDEIKRIEALQKNG